jgi:Ribbon-helix-helix protein, copG family
MAKRKSYGRTASGKSINDELVEQLADQAEAGYEVDETLRRRAGRPPIGSAAASVESVRLDPELRDALAERAERDHETTSSVIRKALRKYLQVG